MNNEKIENEKITYAFGYCRKSPDDKKNTQTSIKNQKDLIEIICKNNKWKLESVQEDVNISGQKEDRIGLLRQIGNAKKKKLENNDSNVYILVKDSKRFARNSSFVKEKFNELESYGVKIFLISSNKFLDISDLGDRIISVVDEQAIFDGKNYAKLTEQVKISKNMPCVPAPFGYKYNKDKNWVIEKKNANIVINVISDYLNSIDYRATIKKNKINKSKYYRIIKNARMGLYSGFICYEKKVKDVNKKVKESNKIIYKGNHQSIISQEIYNNLK